MNEAHNITANHITTADIVHNDSLPANLHDAVEEMRQSSFMQDVLGDHVFTKYIEAKDAEWDRFRTTVTAWELNEYLGKY